MSSGLRILNALPQSMRLTTTWICSSISSYRINMALSQKKLVELIVCSINATREVNKYSRTWPIWAENITVVQSKYPKEPYSMIFMMNSCWFKRKSIQISSKFIIINQSRQKTLNKTWKAWKDSRGNYAQNL